MKWALVCFISFAIPIVGSPARASTASDLRAMYAGSIVRIVSSYDCGDGTAPFEQGTGFLISNRRVVTAYHVLHPKCGDTGLSADPTKVDVFLADGQKRNIAANVWSSREDDILVFEVDDVDGITPVPLGDADAGLISGQRLIAFGHPPVAGQAAIRPDAAVTAEAQFPASRAVTDADCLAGMPNDVDLPRSFIVFKAPVDPGYSGGPVFHELTGKVVGVMRKRFPVCGDPATQEALVTPVNRLPNVKLAPLYCGSDADCGQVDRATHRLIDVRNLPPAEELDTLLHGFGHLDSRYKIAIPRLAGIDLPADARYAVDRVARRLAGGLSDIFGVGVLDEDRLIRLNAPDRLETAAYYATNAKQAGADYVVMATLKYAGPSPAGARMFTVSAKVLRTQDGRETYAFEATFPENHINAGGFLAEEATRISEAIGIPRGSRSTQQQGVDREAQRLAEKAHSEQYAGELVRAQQDYAEALRRDPTLWHYQVEYVRLMYDLGLPEWSRAHADSVLTQLPLTDTTRSIAAELVVERAHARRDMTQLREAVRVAASYGDNALVARALIYYAEIASTISYSLSVEALRRAKQRVGSGRDAWTQCAVDTHIYAFSVTVDSDWKGDAYENFAKLSRNCEEAGNRRLAANAAALAARYSPSPSVRREMLEHAVALSASVGGQPYDTARLTLAEELRSQARYSTSDRLVLDIVKSRLERLIEIYGTIPEPFSELDADLLRLAGVSVPSQRAPRAPTAEQRPLAAAHRRALATALRSWAARTRPDSAKQADTYIDIAARADPTDVNGLSRVAPELALRNWERDAGISVAALTKSKEAPLRTRGLNLDGLMQALYDAIVAESDKPKPDFQRLDALLRQVSVVATWIGGPRQKAVVTTLVAQTKALRGDVVGALSTYDSISIKDDPLLELDVVDRRLRAAERAHLPASELAELRKTRVQKAARASNARWVSAVYESIVEPWDGKNGSIDKLIEPLAECANKLIEMRDWEDAATAYSYAARLVDASQNSEGSQMGVQLIAKRVEMLDAVDDPISSLFARVDFLNERSAVYARFAENEEGVLKTDDGAAALVDDIEARLDKLVRAGYVRIGVRAVTNLYPHGALARGADRLVKKSRLWLKSLKGADEYPSLEANIHRLTALLTPDDGYAVAEARAAAAIFAEQKRWSSVGRSYSNAQFRSRNEAVAWQLFDECEKTMEPVRAVAAPSDEDLVTEENCVHGIGQFILHTFRPLLNRAKVAKAMSVGLRLMPLVDSRMFAVDRFRFRTEMAMMAISNREFSLEKNLTEEVRRFWLGDTGSKPLSVEEWLRHEIRLMRVYRVVDVGRALPMVTQICSADWEAGLDSILEAADVANAARDSAAEKRCLDRARDSVEGASAEDRPARVAMIAVHEAERAEQSQDWASAAVAYGSARQALWNARMQYDWIDQLVLAEAVALAKAGRVDQAQRWTSRLVEDARSFDPAHDQRVCLHSQVLETVAAIALANNDCARGNELARDAARFRKSCTHRVCQATDPVWCDAPSYATWRTKHACGRRLPLDTPGIVNGSR